MKKTSISLFLRYKTPILIECMPEEEEEEAPKSWQSYASLNRDQFSQHSHGIRGQAVALG